MKQNLKHLIDCVKAYEAGIISEGDVKRAAVDYLSDDPNIIPNMMMILEAERKTKKQLLDETNLELSRSLVGYDMFEKNTKQNLEQRKFIIGNIKAHYVKWKDYLRCCFKVDGLD